MSNAVRNARKLASQAATGAAQVFSQHKHFKEGPVGSPQLNRLGLHPLRMLATDACLGVRRAALRTTTLRHGNEEELSGFFQDGVAVVHPFFAPEVFEPLRAEVRAWTEQMAERNPLPNAGARGFGSKQPFAGGFDRFDGSTLNRFLNIDATQLPLTARAIADPRLARICALASGFRHAPDRFYIYQMVQGIAGTHDLQRDPHRDTFHSTVKLWLFLEDTPLSSGPFAYSPGSHRLTWRRHLWEYRRANVAAATQSRRKGGAFRISPDELRQMGAAPIRPYPVKANTLVIADVRGFHCRSLAEQGAQRLTLYANLRKWPFSPLP